MGIQNSAFQGFPKLAYEAEQSVGIIQLRGSLREHRNFCSLPVSCSVSQRPIHIRQGEPVYGRHSDGAKPIFRDGTVLIGLPWSQGGAPTLLQVEAWDRSDEYSLWPAE